MYLKFPKGFLWGSSTSSYQVEGGIENCDWSKDFPAGIACNHSLDRKPRPSAYYYAEICKNNGFQI